MEIAQLAAVLGGRLLGHADTTPVTAVAYDSRRVTPGAGFVAIPGLTADGHDFLGQALENGAGAVVIQEDRAHVWDAISGGWSVPVIVVADTRVALAAAAAALNGCPAARLGVIGITGTDGKTSLTHLVDHVLRSAGTKSGLVTTAECRIGDVQLLDTGRFTTPEAPEMQAMLNAMVEAGCRWAVLEATSHGLALHRLDCCEFDIAAVTTIGSDHLEFHGSRENYIRAKARLFDLLNEGQAKGIAKTAVLNADDPEFGRLRDVTQARIMSYGLNQAAGLWPSDRRVVGWSTQFTLHTPEGSVPVELLGPAPFTMQTALAAAGICLAAGIDLGRIAAGIGSWRGAPGRMELIDEAQPFSVVVDFAHSPDSLHRVLDVLRERTPGRLVAVFGCIGERERDRRFAMGEVAARSADFTIVTDDNPYTEDRDEIIREIVRGLEAGGRRRGHDFAVVPDRREAIDHALSMAVDGDAVLLAGKGHETEVHLVDGAYDCDDRVVARAVLAELMGRPTPP